MTILIERIYNQVADINYISQDEFSTEFCGATKSYLRSMKARKTEASISVLMKLMESLHQRANAMRQGNPHSVLTKAAARYDALAEKVGEEIARRAVSQASASKWVREALVRIINSLNEDKSSKSYQAPPIIIC